MRIQAAVSSAILVLAVLVPLNAAAEPGGDAVVEVRSGSFAPATVAIQPGESVHWVASSAGHDVRADDGRFHFHPGRTLLVGETVSHTFTEDETVRFYCTIHGGPGGVGMSGVVVVGEGSPPPPPPPQPPTVDVNPVLGAGDYTTISAALNAEPASTVIRVHPGQYREALTVQKPGVVIRGVGATPGDVVLEGANFRQVGVDVRSEDVRLENLTIRGYKTAGVIAEHVDGLRLQQVDVLPLPEPSTTPHAYGVRTRGVRFLVLDRVQIRAAQLVGVQIDECVACDAVLSNLDVADSQIGVRVRNGRGVVLRDSVVRDNVTGVVLQTLPPQEGAAQRGAHLVNNVIEGNHRSTPWMRTAALPDVPSGTGVWIAGGWDNLIERNRIQDHVHNVAITWLTVPTRGNRVVANIVGAARAADIGWDGVGAQNCFSDNVKSDGGPADTSPIGLQTINACSGGAAVGAPNPAVMAAILQHAWATHWCKERNLCGP